MADHSALAAQPTRELLPSIRRIGPADVIEALALGFDDFWSKPSHVIFICLIYPIVGLLIGRVITGYELLPLLYPLATGFALIGPFAAIGLYEISRRREQQGDAHWQDALDVFRSHSIRPILALGAVLVAIFVAWLAAAHAI